MAPWIREYILLLLHKYITIVYCKWLYFNIRLADRVRYKILSCTANAHLTPFPLLYLSWDYCYSNNSFVFVAVIVQGYKKNKTGKVR